MRKSGKKLSDDTVQFQVAENVTRVLQYRKIK